MHDAGSPDMPGPLVLASLNWGIFPIRVPGVCISPYHPGACVALGPDHSTAQISRTVGTIRHEVGLVTCQFCLNTCTTSDPDSLARHVVPI